MSSRPGFDCMMSMYSVPFRTKGTRLPGAGYEALHPELKDIHPEDYPDINKLAILADVAPYSREYNNFRLKVGKQSQSNTELQIEYEKILDRVRQTRESVIRMTDRHFTAPVEEVAGTVDSVSPGGFTLKQFPGRKFQFSSVGLSAADMSARILGEHNNMIRSEVAQEVDRRRSAQRQYLTDNLSGDVQVVIHQVSPSCRTQKPSRTRGRRALPYGDLCPGIGGDYPRKTGSPGTRYCRYAGSENSDIFRGDRTSADDSQNRGNTVFPRRVLTS